MGGGGGGGILGPVGEVLLGDSGAEAAGNAAISQQIEANRQYADTRRRVDSASGQLSSSFDQARGQMDRATVSGLMSLDRDIGLQEKNLARQEQLISQIDPTIIEASQQALRLLRGEQSSALNPIKGQRDMQRQKLVNSLREQLGPGAETSTAGIQALTRFDSETGNLMAGAQQQALGNLGGLAQQFTSTRPDMLREIAARSGFGQQKYNLGAGQAGFTADLGARQAQFGLSGAQLLSGAGQSSIESAGAGYTSTALRGQAAAQFGKFAIGTAASMIGGGAPTPTKGDTAGQSYKDFGVFA